MKYILTGGTGFLGSRLAVRLLKNGNEVIFMSRTKKGRTARERVVHILKQVNPSINEVGIFVVDIDLTDNNLLKTPKLLDLKNIDGIWHLAANLSFKEDRREEVFKDNVGVIKNITELAKYYRCPIFYTSTAYVHGRTTGTIISEKTSDGPHVFNNPYEESKFEAEKLLNKWGSDNGNNFIIFKPSILVEQNRKTLSFFGYYSVIATLSSLKQGIEKFIKKHPIISRIFRIYEKDGVLAVPIPFPYVKNSHLNLMPVEIAVEWMVAVANNKNTLGKTYHITNPKPFSMEEITKQTLSGLKMKFIVFSAPKFIVGAYFSFLSFLGLFNKHINSLAKTLKYYKYYMTSSNNYATDGIRKEVGGKKFDKRFQFEDNFLEKLSAEFVAKLHRYHR